MSKTFKYKFLVIDNLNLLEISNLARKVNQAVKHPEPVIKLDAPWDKPDEVFDYLNVLYDENEKVFKMWYDVLGAAEQWNPLVNQMAYATSTDGIHWDRPILNMVEHKGSKQNNYFTPNLKCGLYGSIIIDPSDIPARRYKMIFMLSSYGLGDGMDWAKFHVALNLAYSADGLNWDRPTHVNPIMRGVSDGGYVFCYDSDRRKYIVISRRVPNLPRDISQYESYDLVNWEDKGRILVPDELDPSTLFNFHTFTPFRYEDFYLGMLDVQYSLPGAETYEVYHKPPADYPDQRVGIIEFQLAYSRNGSTWSRLPDRSAVVPVGEPDSPDAGIIFAPLSSPFTVNGETYLYYTASCCRHSSWSRDEFFSSAKHDLRSQMCGMLAKMPEDHWVSLDGGKDGGWFTTKPWGPPHEIFVNADAKGGSIEAELITPYGQPVKDYTRKECIPVTANGKGQQLKWKNGKSAWETIAKDHLGGLLIKFYITNAKLYSYTFTLPDPDGQLERDRLNARWCEHIKHRSDNWGKNSNEPAIGIPPYAASGLKDR